MEGLRWPFEKKNETIYALFLLFIFSLRIYFIEKEKREEAGSRPYDLLSDSSIPSQHFYTLSIIILILLKIR